MLDLVRGTEAINSNPTDAHQTTEDFLRHTETGGAADNSVNGDSTGAQVWGSLQETKTTTLKGKDALSSLFMIFPLISLWPPHGPDYHYVYMSTLQPPWLNWEEAKPFAIVY